MSDSQILVSRELLRNVKREVDDLRDERDHLHEQLRLAALVAEAAAASSAAAAAPADGDPDLRDQLERAVARTFRAAEELTALRAELAEARRALGAAQAEAAAARAEADDLRRTHPFPPLRPGSTAATADKPPAGGPKDVVGRAFAAWCRRNRALVSRPYLFATFLQSAAEGMEVEVTPVYRDRTAAAPTFRAEAVDGLEYWLVRLGPATMLLPQPLSPGQFRELAPAFDGQATPETVGAVVPADIAAEGGAHVLAAAGHVTAEA